MSRRPLWICALALFCSAFGSPAQSTPAPGPVGGQQVTVGQSITPLTGPWKFHLGDSPLDPVTHRPLWAQPGFDDSQWESVDLTPADGSVDPSTAISGYVPGWTAHGHSGVSGYGWYRLRVNVTAKAGQRLALAGPDSVDDAYQAFADGMPLGSSADFSSDPPRVFAIQPAVFPLAEGSTNRIELAFRTWMRPGALDAPAAGGLHTPPVIGEDAAVRGLYRLHWLDLFRSNAMLLGETAMFLLFAIFSFSLILFDRSDPVYVWMGAIFLDGFVANGLSALATTTHRIPWQTVQLLNFSVTMPFFLGGWFMIWWTWFRFRRPSWLPKLVILLAPLCVVSFPIGQKLVDGIPSAVSGVFQIVSQILIFFFVCIFGFLVIQGIRRQGVEGWLTLPTAILNTIALLPGSIAFLHMPEYWFVGGVEVDMVGIANLMIMATLAVLLLRRLFLSLRRQRRLALDVKQAQEVQQVILPEASAVLPGLTIQSEYRPALEVGGDFFQIIPNPADESLLIVAGDVTGKGLKAGMLVAVLIGSIRTAAESTTDPHTILEILNRRLVGRGDAHATCLVLRIASDGSATLANAGHMPPYLNGKPLPLEGALPLGLIAGADFSTLEFHIHEGDRLLLLSDGVAEAQNASRELFGFERIETLLTGTPAASTDRRRRPVLGPGGRHQRHLSYPQRCYRRYCGISRPGARKPVPGSDPSSQRTHS